MSHLIWICHQRLQIFLILESFNVHTQNKMKKSTEEEDEEEEERAALCCLVLCVCLFICCCVVSFFYRSWKKLISSYSIRKMLIYGSESEFCVRNTIENFVLRDVGHRFCLSFRYSQKVVLFHGTQVKVNFGARKKSTTLCAPIFMKLKISQQIYIQFSCT